MLTKQEQLKLALTQSPIDAKYGTDENRIAIVTCENTLYHARYNDIIIAEVKRPDDIANLLIDKRYTQKSKWANITELKFECEVLPDTPTKGGMKKPGGKIALIKSQINALTQNIKSDTTKSELIKIINEIQSLVNTSE